MHNALIRCRWRCNYSRYLLFISNQFHALYGIAPLLSIYIYKRSCTWKNIIFPTPAFFACQLCCTDCVSFIIILYVCALYAILSFACRKLQQRSRVNNVLSEVEDNKYIEIEYIERYKFASYANIHIAWILLRTHTERHMIFSFAIILR